MNRSMGDTRGRGWIERFGVLPTCQEGMGCRQLRSEMVMRRYIKSCNRGPWDGDPGLSRGCHLWGEASWVGWRLCTCSFDPCRYMQGMGHELDGIICGRRCEHVITSTRTCKSDEYNPIVRKRYIFRCSCECRLAEDRYVYH